MLNTLEFTWFDLGLAHRLFAQAFLTPEETVLVFPAPKFLVALLAGVVMAFAFQLLLTNLTVAVKFSSGVDLADDEEETIGAQIRKSEAKIGLWALTTASIALFSACFLAVKLSSIESALIGAIIGIVIWSTYFTIVMWLGSSAVGSLIGSLVSSVTNGLQGLMGTATATIGANVAKNQMVSTAEDITAAVRKELTSGLDVKSVQKTLQSSLSSLELPKLDLKEIRQQFDRLLKESDIKDVADSDLLKNIDRQTFVDLISSRTDLSKQDINRIADELEDAWKQVLTSPQNSTEKVINLLQQASPDELKSDKLGEKIQELVTVGGGNGKQNNGVLKQAVQYGVSAAVPAVLERLDLSEVDVDKITHQLQNLKDKVQGVDLDNIIHQLEQLKDKTTEQVERKFATSPTNTVKADVEDYLSNSFPWHLNRITLQEEFREVIYDPSAEPGSVRKQLEGLNQEYFANLLRRRDDIDPEAIDSMTEQMESIRQEVLQTVREEETKEKSEDLRSRIENYLRSTGKEELNPDEIEREFSSVLEDPEAGLEELQNRFSQFDRDTLVQLLGQREDINQEEANNIVSQLESTRDRVLNRARELQEQAQNKAQELRQKVEEYLRNTNKEELNPDAIEKELRTLLEDPQAGLAALRTRISQFNRDTLVQLLAQRQDLSEEQINQIIDRAETVRDSILQAPQQAAEQAKHQYEQTTTAIAQYLRNTKLEELNPEGIQQDLAQLLSNPQEGASALRNRLSQMDRETLVKLLSQREDLSEEQINKTIDRLQEAIQNLVKAPRHLVDRATKQALDFEENLESYLRNTNKEELNPDSIKRDLQLLLNDPRAGVDSLGDRLSKFDRSTIVALLSQREDISEEEANQIVDRIFSVRDAIAEQFQQIQQRVQSVIDSIFARIRDYLNSLERPELNYESIQQDFAKLFDDPQAGFEALRDRLSQFDRDTLVAVLSSREDISEEQANKIIDRIEETRDNVLQQGERIQQETQKRLSAIKEQTKQQMKEARKALVDAAWWLFGAALTSLVASAIAGFVAVAGLPFVV
jgi:nucleoid DNA-binding protein